MATKSTTHPIIYGDCHEVLPVLIMATRLAEGVPYGQLFISHAEFERLVAEESGASIPLALLDGGRSEGM
jgi:hypothetical protein